MSFVDTVVGKANKAATFVKPYLPTIGIVGGSIAVCVGGFITGRATLNVDRILNEHNDMLDSTRRENNGYSEEEYSEVQRKKDVFGIYGVTAGKLVRHYAPGISLCAVGFACIFSGLGALRKWHALAVSAAAALDESFSEYRGNVIKELGEEADRKFLIGDKYDGGPKKISIEKAVIDENGEAKVESEEVYAVENIFEDDFTRVFDYRNPKWDNSFVLNDNFLNEVQRWYTKQLRTGHADHVFLNTIFKELGFAKTGIGHFYGWTNKPGCVVGIDVTPYIEMWGSDDDEQFPLYVPFATARDDENGTWYFINEEDEKTFRNAYIEDEHKVGFILHFDVDTNENGIPKNIYDDVYNKHLKKIA